MLLFRKSLIFGKSLLVFCSWTWSLPMRNNSLAEATSLFRLSRCRILKLKNSFLAGISHQLWLNSHLSTFLFLIIAGTQHVANAGCCWGESGGAVHICRLFFIAPGCPPWECTQPSALQRAAVEGRPEIGLEHSWIAMC